MRDQYMRAGEGFIICYSITDRRSFHEVREFKQLIYRVRRTDETPVVLVGNKSDLGQLRQVKGSPLRQKESLGGLHFHAGLKACGAPPSSAASEPVPGPNPRVKKPQMPQAGRKQVFFPNIRRDLAGRLTTRFRAKEVCGMQELGRGPDPGAPRLQEGGAQALRPRSQEGISSHAALFLLARSPKGKGPTWPGSSPAPSSKPPPPSATTSTTSSTPW